MPPEVNCQLPSSTFAATAARRAVSRARPTILIADDSADSREVMELLLENDGYQVAAAGDGLRAIEVALQTLPDLLLIDLDLPELDGLSVVRDLRSRPQFASTPIVIVSGHDPIKYRQVALDAGCDDYILKPINFNRLHETIENARRLIHPT